MTSGTLGDCSVRDNNGQPIAGGVAILRIDKWKHGHVSNAENLSLAFLASSKSTNTFTVLQSVAMHGVRIAQGQIMVPK
jgi:hypothetical protein